MRILVSGVHGFVGSNLSACLSQENQIYGIDIISPRSENVLQTFGWDELGEMDTSRFDAVIHLAGKAHDMKKTSDAGEYFNINTGLTRKIFDFFLRSDARVFIFFSSVKAAADHIDGDILTEAAPPRPVGPYGESKIAAENYIREKTLEFSLTTDMGKSVYILRPCMIHGPGNKGNLNLLYSLAGKGLPWPLGAFDNRRTFTSVENLNFIVKRLIEGEAAPGIYNIGDDEPVSTNELIGIIARCLGKKPRIIRLPRWTVRGIARMGDILRLPLNRERLVKLTEDYVVSNDKIKKALDVDSLPVRARDGLTDTIRSFSQG